MDEARRFFAFLLQVMLACEVVLKYNRNSLSTHQNMPRNNKIGQKTELPKGRTAPLVGRKPADKTVRVALSRVHRSSNRDQGAGSRSVRWEH